MKDKIKLEVEKIDRILNNENAHGDWIKGRHSALRGVKVALENILNGEAVKLREVCSKKTQHNDMKSANWKYCSECGKKL